MLGLEPAAIQMDRNLIKNRATLWKLVGKGPGLQPLQLLATMKQRFKHETAAFGFDLVRMEVACAILVQELARSLKLDFRDMDLERIIENPDTVYDRLCSLLLKVLCGPAREKLQEAYLSLNDGSVSMAMSAAESYPRDTQKLPRLHL